MSDPDGLPLRSQGNREDGPHQERTTHPSRNPHEQLKGCGPGPPTPSLSTGKPAKATTRPPGGWGELPSKKSIDQMKRRLATGVVAPWPHRTKTRSRAQVEASRHGRYWHGPGEEGKPDRDHHRGWGADREADADGAGAPVRVFRGSSGGKDSAGGLDDQRVGDEAVGRAGPRGSRRRSELCAMYAQRSRRGKTDERDARALAEACRLGAYRPAHRTSEGQRHVRALLAVRESLVRTRVRFVALVQAVLSREGFRVATGTTKCSSARVEDLELPEHLPIEIGPLLSMLGPLNEQIQALDARLDDNGARDRTLVHESLEVPIELGAHGCGGRCADSGREQKGQGPGHPHIHGGDPVTFMDQMKRRRATPGRGTMAPPIQHAHRGGPLVCPRCGGAVLAENDRGGPDAAVRSCPCAPGQMAGCERQDLPPRLSW